MLEEFQNAAEEMGIPRTSDFNTGNNYGIGYFSLFVLTLFPPVFRRFTQKLLDDWDENKATVAEKEIANQFKNLSIS